MVSNLNERLNEYLSNEKIPKEKFDDLKHIANYTNFNKKILDWFMCIQSFEVVGWRNKQVTKRICEILQMNEPIHFYSLFCPSYKKGEGATGFRTDDVGNTTKNGINNLMKFKEITENLGFKCDKPEAIFFDIALEQPEKTMFMIDDLKKNIQNFKKYVPLEMQFDILSNKFPELMDIIGYRGVVIDPLPIDNVILNRVVERGKKFYELFGWNEEKIIRRSKVIASSEATVGTIIRHRMPNAIMIYTPTMLERAQIYSGKCQEKPLPILIPKRNA